MGTRRHAQTASLISDLVPTCADEVTGVTRLELDGLTASDGEVFGDDTLELYVDRDPSR